MKRTSTCNPAITPSPLRSIVRAGIAMLVGITAGVTGLAEVASAQGTIIPEGEYVFSTAAEPGVFGEDYLVFEVQGDRAVGAFYWPQSEFECFTGAVEQGRLAVQVRNLYEGTVSQATIPLQTRTEVASSGAGVAPFGVDGMQRLSGLSDVDRNLLDQCRTAIAQ